MSIKHNGTGRTKACGYLRVSTDGQIDTSIPVQRKRLLELAEREGYEIIKWYTDEGRSGSRNTNQRIDWLKLLAESATANWEVILCYNRSPFGRLDSIEEGFAKQTLREARKRLHTFVEGLMDWETATGRIIDTIRAEESHEYARKLGLATLEGKLNAFLEGKPYGKTCPYGMARRVVDPQGQEREVRRLEKFMLPKGWSQRYVLGDPDEVETVLWLFTTFATKDVGFRWLARQLNNRSVPSPHGSKWNPSIVSRILRNETYVGDTRIGKYKTGKFARLDGEHVVHNQNGPRWERSEGLLRQETHEGLVDRPTWDLVQGKFKRRGGGPRRHARGEGGYALTGILLCGHCGKTLYARANKGKRKSGRLLYVCRSGTLYGNESGCAQWQIEERDILPLVVNKLADEVDLRVLKGDSVQPPDPQKKRGAVEIARLESKLAELDRKISVGSERLLELPVEHTRDTQAKMTEWRTQRAVLADEIERAKDSKPKVHEEMLEWQRWLASAREKLIEVQRSPERGSGLEPGLLFLAGAFRESLQRFGCRVACWWRKEQIAGSKLWAVDRVRIQLGTGPVETGPKAAESEGSVSAPNGAHRLTCAPFGVATIDLVLSASEMFTHPGHAQTLPEVKRLAAEGATSTAIAAHLNSQGFTTRQGKPWNSSRVLKYMDRHGIPCPRPPRLTDTQILEWADAHHLRTGNWPTRRAGSIPEAPGDTWSAVDAALDYGTRGLQGGRSLPKLLMANGRGRLR